MSLLWTPPNVSRELRDGTRAYEAEVFEMVDRFHGVLRYWNGVLKAKDPNLEMIFAKPHGKPVMGLLPGRFHVVRHVPGGPPSLLPIVGPDGEFVEPTHRVLDMLDGRDLWDERARTAQRKFLAAREREERRAKEVEAEQRSEELRDRWRAVSETSVSMNRRTPWSQNVKGRRGVR